MIQNEISVFVWFGATAIAEIAESCDWPRRILKQIDALGDEPRGKLRRQDIVGDDLSIGLGHTAYDFVENAHVVRGGV